MNPVGAGQTPFPYKYWSPAAVQGHSTLLANAAAFPNGLRQLLAQNRHEDLHEMLIRIQDFKDLQLPHDYQNVTDIMRIRQASDTLLVHGILDACTDIALAERWYDPTYYDTQRSFAVSSIF